MLSVKPQAMDKVLPEIGDRVKPGALVVSIAAGVDIATLEAALSERARRARDAERAGARPCPGATAISGGTHAGAEELALARALFEAVGIAIELDESQLDAVTGLSGSGPAYIFSFSKRSPTPA